MIFILVDYNMAKAVQLLARLEYIHLKWCCKNWLQNSQRWSVSATCKLHVHSPKPESTPQRFCYKTHVPLRHSGAPAVTLAAVCFCRKRRNVCAHPSAESPSRGGWGKNNTSGASAAATWSRIVMMMKTRVRKLSVWQPSRASTKEVVAWEVR